jgi:hypothetical protein
MATFLEIKSKLSQALKDGSRVVGVDAQKYFQKQIDKQTYSTRL